MGELFHLEEQHGNVVQIMFKVELFRRDLDTDLVDEIEGIIFSVIIDELTRKYKLVEVEDLDAEDYLMDYLRSHGLVPNNQDIYVQLLGIMRYNDVWYAAVWLSDKKARHLTTEGKHFLELRLVMIPEEVAKRFIEINERP